jgi:hypothetical protein
MVAKLKVIKVELQRRMHDRMAEVGAWLRKGFSQLNGPAHRCLCLRFKQNLAVSPARLKARMDSLLPFL